MSHASARPTPLELARGVGALALATAAFFGTRMMGVAPGAGALFALGYLVISGLVAGSIAAFFGLPRVVGHLFAGLLAGPQGFALFSVEDVQKLSLVNALALALIALQAGAEMTLSMLARTARSVLSSAGAQIIVMIPLMAAVFYFGRGAIPFAEGQTQEIVLALALLWAVTSLTRSPAVTLAVLSETRAKGPLSDHALGIAVLLDVLILPLFALALAIARGQLLAEPFDLDGLKHLGNELFASVAAGVTFGLVVASLLRVVQRERALVLIVLAYAVTALCAYLRYDTLLVFVIAGFLVMNLTRQGGSLIETSDKLATPVMIVFFATAGAKLDLQALLLSWPVALALVAARTVATFVSARVGHTVARDPPAVTRNAWLTLVSQAGVTIGLATIIAEALPGVGPGFASLTIAVVGINTILGAVVFKVALSRAGEIPASASEPEAATPALVPDTPEPPAPR